MHGFIILGVITALCSGQLSDAPGYASSVMYGNKPILRYGHESIEPTEPPRRSFEENIRNSIQNQENPYKVPDLTPDQRLDFKTPMAPDVTADQNSDFETPMATLPFKPEHSGAYTLLLGGKICGNVIVPIKMDSYSRVLLPVRSHFKAQWEKDLQSYIKGLMGQYGRTHLDVYVVPVVEAIEANNKVTIKDIDGEILVNWRPVEDARTSDKPNPRSHFVLDLSELQQLINGRRHYD